MAGTTETIPSCTAILKNMPFCPGKTVLPGIRNRIYVIAHADVAKFPDFARDTLGRPTSSVYNGNFTPKEGSNFKLIDHINSKAEPKSDPQGEEPSVTFNCQLTVVHQEVDEAATEAITPFLNTPVIVIMEDMRGKFRVFGNHNYPAKIAPSQALGSGPTGTVGTTLVITSTEEVSMPFYSGEIPTDDGTINEAVPEGAGS